MADSSRRFPTKHQGQTVSEMMSIGMTRFADAVAVSLPTEVDILMIELRWMFETVGVNIKPRNLAV